MSLESKLSKTSNTTKTNTVVEEAMAVKEEGTTEETTEEMTEEETIEEVDKAFIKRKAILNIRAEMTVLTGLTEVAEAREKGKQLCLARATLKEAKAVEAAKIINMSRRAHH